MKKEILHEHTHARILPFDRIRFKLNQPSGCQFTNCTLQFLEYIIFDADTVLNPVMLRIPINSLPKECCLHPFQSAFQVEDRTEHDLRIKGLCGSGFE